ncbi:MAG: GNAT family N-acetyltransferase [Pseudomonadota bacterium]
MSEVTITPAETHADLNAVRILCWAYRDHLMTLSQRDRDIIEVFYPVPKYTAILKDLAQLHARPRGIILLAKDQSGTGVGCGMTHALDEATSEIKRVYVGPQARGKGVARQLCEMLIEQARRDGFGRVVLDTSKALHTAQRLYHRLGFSPRGPYQQLPEDVVPDLMFFEKRLSANEGAA